MLVVSLSQLKDSPSDLEKSQVALQTSSSKRQWQVAQSLDLSLVSLRHIQREIYKKSVLEMDVTYVNFLYL